MRSLWCAWRQASLHVFGAFDGDLHDLRGIELAIAAFGGFDHCAGEVSEGLPREGLSAEGYRFARRRCFAQWEFAQVRAH